MRLPVKCHLCEADILGRGTPAAIIGTAGLLSMSPRRFHHWTCHKGHNNWVWFAHPLYEILLFRGIQELAEDDTRGATLSFYSAWDNFVAYWIGQVTVDGWHDNLPGRDLLGNAERALGLYAGLFYGIVHSWPLLVSDRSREIRNKVIHGNLIPAGDQVLGVGRDVQQAIVDGWVPTSESYSSFMDSPRVIERLQRDLKAAPGELVQDGKAGRALQALPLPDALVVLGLKQSFAKCDLDAAVANPRDLELGTPIAVHRLDTRPA